MLIIDAIYDYFNPTLDVISLDNSNVINDSDVISLDNSNVIDDSDDNKYDQYFLWGTIILLSVAAVYYLWVGSIPPDAPDVDVEFTIPSNLSEKIANHQFMRGLRKEILQPGSVSIANVQLPYYEGIYRSEVTNKEFIIQYRTKAEYYQTVKRILARNL